MFGTEPREQFVKPAQPFLLRLKPRAGFHRRGHIALAMLAVLVAVGIVPLATMSWKLIGKNRETLTTEQQAYQVLLATSMAYELDLHVEGLRSELLRVAQTLGAAVRRSGTIPTKEIQRVLGEVTDTRVAYVRYSYFSGAAVKSVSAGDYPESLEALFAATLSRAAEDHAHQGAGNERARTILSEPLTVDGSDSALLAVAAPVAAGGSFRGVLTALVDLDRLWKAVALRNTTGHLLFAVDEGGKVFATSDGNQIATGTDVSDWRIVDDFLSFGKVGTRKSTPFETERDGRMERYIGLYEVTRQGWGIFVQARDEDIYWVVGDMVRSTLTWTLVLLGVAVLAAIYFARTLSNPINRLAAVSRALAGGDFSARVHVRSRNEIGELAHAFNSMAADIETYIRRLKKAFEDNNELFLGTIRALAQAIDAKDPYTRGHSMRVSRYSMILGHEMKLSEEDLRDLHVSSLLHDVGKIGIDDAILKKTGRLTDEEYEIIKTHAALGATIMSPIRQMKKMIPGLRHHHERCNGGGYPDGLTRDQIPLMARIIAVADTFDAITTVRPYQSPMTFKQAVMRINELRGDALDDQVVDAFNEVCERGRLELGAGDDQQEVAIPAPPPPLETDLAPVDSA
jgi:HD-GYP domain-containing protein (c-di-GMP phosphodiesterase class II)